jgi:hypothetical protein
MPCCTPPIVPIPGTAWPEAVRGTIARKPWQYAITAVIPCLDHSAETKLCVAILRLQTLRPYILLIDTGSRPHEARALEEMRAPDLEIHSIRANALPHTCSAIAAALDLGFSLAATPYAFTTHQDCFLRDRHFLDFLAQKMPLHSVVGYQISPRRFEGWEKWFGHTAALWDLRDLDRIGATWTLRRAAAMLGMGPLATTPDPLNHIDTETAMNLAILRAGLATEQIGSEINFERTRDSWIDHARSLICTKLYFPDKYQAARAACDLAMIEAQQRISRWQYIGPAEPGQD